MAAITAIELNKSSVELYPGNEEALTLTKTPEDGEGTIVWESSDEDVATVDDGTITAVAPGEATITAKVDGTEIEAGASVKVKVLEVPEFGLDSGKISAGVMYLNTDNKI